MRYNNTRGDQRLEKLNCFISQVPDRHFMFYVYILLLKAGMSVKQVFCVCVCVCALNGLFLYFGGVL